uniref:Uncharacterized protein n=1 Tax=Rhizophora mucronata TaxID=61149 RepID=A0A2P2PNV4_RHIMU
MVLLVKILLDSFYFSFSDTCTIFLLRLFSISM